MKSNYQNKYNTRKSDTSILKDAFQDLLHSYKIKDKFNATQLVSSWGKLMGSPIASRTEKVFMKERKLFVKLTSAPLKHELNLSKTKVLDIFKKEFGENSLEDIVFL